MSVGIYNTGEYSRILDKVLHHFGFKSRVSNIVHNEIMVFMDPDETQDQISCMAGIAFDMTTRVREGYVAISFDDKDKVMMMNPDNKRILGFAKDGTVSDMTSWR